MQFASDPPALRGGAAFGLELALEARPRRRGGELRPRSTVARSRTPIAQQASANAIGTSCSQDVCRFGGYEQQRDPARTLIRPARVCARGTYRPAAR